MRILKLLLALLAFNSIGAFSTELKWEEDQISMALVYGYEIANPFPALYLFDKENNVVLYGKGKDSLTHKKLVEQKFSTMNILQDETTSKATEVLTPYILEDSRYKLVLISLDEKSFNGTCIPCEEVKVFIEKNLSKSESIKTLHLKAVN
jgi:hypothetical protein